MPACNLPIKLGSHRHVNLVTRRLEAIPRYLIERHFSDGLGLTPDERGSQAATAVIDNNAHEGVTWLHSYVTLDKNRTFCIDDGPSPEAIRKCAERNGLLVDRITEMRVLDPYFHM